MYINAEGTLKNVSIFIWLLLLNYMAFYYYILIIIIIYINTYRTNRIGEPLRLKFYL